MESWQQKLRNPKRLIQICDTTTCVKDKTYTRL